MSTSDIFTLGWREWIELPELGLPPIKAKVDTGARTSALHAFSVNPYVENGVQRVEFSIHPQQHNNDYEVACTAAVIDHRSVTDSGGHKEDRWVIETPMIIGKHRWPIEMTLTSRDDMRFRMLLGRTAITGRAYVDPAASYLIGKRRRGTRQKKQS